MAEQGSIVDDVLAVMLARVEDGTGDIAAAKQLSENIDRADLAPTENLQEHLAWETKPWWTTDEGIKIRNAVTELLRSWAQMWPNNTGFFAYRADVLRDVLMTPQRVALPEASQEFIQAELIEIASRMKIDWVTETISHLSPLAESRAVLVETALRAIVHKQDSTSMIPDELLQSITTVNTNETDRAFDIWLQDFGPSHSEVWKVLLAMERERWQDIGQSVDGYVHSLPPADATAFVKQIAVSQEEDAIVLLKAIDPTNTIQKRLAVAQQDFLTKATNSERRREALKRIGALKLSTKEARSQLVDQIFKTASKSDKAAYDVFNAFPKHLRDAPGVRSRYKSLKKKVAPTVWDRAERFRKKVLRF